jgi:hypothetical protein
MRIYNMKTILDDTFAEDVKDEVMALSDELTNEQLIPGLVKAIRLLAMSFPDPDRILDEVVRLLEEDD